MNLLLRDDMHPIRPLCWNRPAYADGTWERNALELRRAAEQNQREVEQVLQQETAQLETIQLKYNQTLDQIKLDELKYD